VYVEVPGFETEGRMVGWSGENVVVVGGEGRIGDGRRGRLRADCRHGGTPGIYGWTAETFVSAGVDDIKGGRPLESSQFRPMKRELTLRYDVCFGGYRLVRRVATADPRKPSASCFSLLACYPYLINALGPPVRNLHSAKTH
jgi:hypothetical protein